MARWALAYVTAYPLAALVQALIIWSDWPAYRRFYRWTKMVYNNLGTRGYVTPKEPSLYGTGAERVLTAAGNLVSVVDFALLILFLVWQYRAATLARRLGYPARRSPGWGVAVWFIPVVNIWMPYQAIRDCLPSGHPARALLWRLLMLVVVIGVLSVAAGISIFVSEPVGVTLLVVVWIGELGAAVLARRVVHAVGTDHARAVAIPS